jgi:hypothetical protein
MLCYHYKRPQDMGRLGPRGQRLGRVFNSRNRRKRICQEISHITKTGKLKAENSAKKSFRLSPISFCIPEDKCWAGFSTLEIGICVYVKKFHTCQKQANLKLKTRPKNLFGCLPLAFALQRTNTEPKF